MSNKSMTQAEIHIRKRPIPKRGNRWYRDKDIRVVGTLCGAMPTPYDLMHNTKESDWRWCNSVGRPVCDICQEEAIAERGL